MLNRSKVLGLIGSVIVLGAYISRPIDAGAQSEAFACDARTLQGTYGAQIQGTRPVPPSLGGGIETVIGVVIRTYDGAGSFTQVDNVKGSVTGIVPDRDGSGTYIVNPDCSAVASLQPGPGILIEERMVIVHDGGEVRSITAAPAALMVTAVGKRIDRR